MCNQGTHHQHSPDKLSAPWLRAPSPFTAHNQEKQILEAPSTKMKLPRPFATRGLVIVLHAPWQAVPVSVNDELQHRIDELMSDGSLTNNDRRDRLIGSMGCRCPALVSVSRSPSLSVSRSLGVPRSRSLGQLLWLKGFNLTKLRYLALA